MNSIYTAKVLAHKNTFANKMWFYDFRELSRHFSEQNCKRVLGKLSSRYSELTKKWDKEKNSEWLCRIYLSAKMIMTATMQLNALDYAHKKNMRLVSPYLSYYSFLSLLRGLVYTLPEVNWDNANLVAISHSKAINLAFDHIANFDKELSGDLKEKFLRVKAFRELISYRSPSSGDTNIPPFDGILSIATLLAEVAQFNSEILEESLLRNANKESFAFLSKHIESLSIITIGTVQFFDKEDSYRLNYLRRKYPLPPNILHIMTEGHVEDFFGAWLSEEEMDDSFDPDENWGLIFDIP